MIRIYLCVAVLGCVVSEIKCAGAPAVLQRCDTLVLHVFSSKDRSQYYSVGSRVFLTLILHKSHTAQHCGGWSDNALSTTLVRRPSPHPLLFICCPCNPPWNAPHSEATLFCVCPCSRFISKDHFCVLSSFEKHFAYGHHY